MGSKLSKVNVIGLWLCSVNSQCYEGTLYRLLAKNRVEIVFKLRELKSSVKDGCQLR